MWADLQKTSRLLSKTTGKVDSIYKDQNEAGDSLRQKNSGRLVLYRR
jgi:hypothetical protein